MSNLYDPARTMALLLSSLSLLRPQDIALQRLRRFEDNKLISLLHIGPVRTRKTLVEIYIRSGMILLVFVASTVIPM